MRAYRESWLWLAVVWALVADGSAASLPMTDPVPAPATDAVNASSGVRTLQLLKNGSYPAECGQNGVMCLPKCCPLGFFFSRNSCIPDDGSGFDPYVVSYTTREGKSLVEWSVQEYYLVIGQPCKEWARVDISELDVWSNGQLVVYKDKISSESDTIDPGQFCLEYSINDTEAIVCTKPNSETVLKGFSSWLSTSGMVISVMCLVLTLLVYLCVDALRDLHGKSLICHVSCLAIAYTMLASVQLSGESLFGPRVCRHVAFGIQFFLLSSFLWLHVMVLDAFWCVLEATGSSPVPYPRAKKWVYDTFKKQWVTGISTEEIDEAQEEEKRIKGKKKERKVFMVYSVYAWTLSFLPVLVVIAHKFSPTIPYTYVDRNMELYCEFLVDSNQESLFYFYPYTAVFIIFNLIIFICILIKAVPFPWNPTGPHRVPKQKARMCFLLFVLMSSNWVIDLISWALGGKQFVWIMLHAFYILQGLITFLIFVLEDRVKDRIIHKLWPRIRRINKKYGCCHHTQDEEEATALRNNVSLNSAATNGWVLCNK